MIYCQNISFKCITLSFQSDTSFGQMHFRILQSKDDVYIKLHCRPRALEKLKTYLWCYIGFNVWKCVSIYIKCILFEFFSLLVLDFFFSFASSHWIKHSRFLSNCTNLLHLLTLFLGLVFPQSDQNLSKRKWNIGTPCLTLILLEQKFLERKNVSLGRNLKNLFAIKWNQLSISSADNLLKKILLKLSE